MPNVFYIRPYVFFNKIYDAVKRTYFLIAIDMNCEFVFYIHLIHDFLSYVFGEAI